MLVTAAIIITLIGCIHSYLGEQKVLMPLFQKVELKTATRRVLRVSWHLITLFWFAIAAQLITMHFDFENSGRNFLVIMAATFAISTAISLINSKGKHISWIGFGMAAILLGWQAVA